MALLLAGVMSISFLIGLKDLYVMFWWPSYNLMGILSDVIVYYLGSSVGGLSLALVIVALQSVFSPRSPEATTIDRPRLAIGLFSLLWVTLMIVVVSAVPILAAWGFALCISPL